MKINKKVRILFMGMMKFKKFLNRKDYNSVECSRRFFLHKILEY